MKQALVLGATGSIGGEVARELVSRGWQVRALCRHAGADIEGVTWIRGDAMVGADVVAAARGVDAIIHAVNPPGYKDWDKLVLPMIANTIAAAQASGARIVLPGTIYNFGGDAPQLLSEDTPQQPSSRKGAIRVEMEQMLRGAGVRTLIVRAGDFFGPRPGQNWFSQCLAQAGKPVTRPFARKVGHSWAYLPDLAATMVQLLERELALATFEVVHFRGHWDADGEQMVAAVQRQRSTPDAPVRDFPWRWLRLLTPFVPFLRELREMRYLAEQPFELDNRKLVSLLGAEPHTPLDQAVGRALSGA